MYMRGNKGSPCFPPLLTSNTGDRSPFTNTLPCCSFIRVASRLMKFGGKSIVSKT